MAYYFKWARGEIMGMTGYERKVWLSQIDRIHREAKKARETEMREQAQYLADLRNQEEE